MFVSFSFPLSFTLCSQKFTNTRVCVESDANSPTPPPPPPPPIKGVLLNYNKNDQHDLGEFRNLSFRLWKPPPASELDEGDRTSTRTKSNIVWVQFGFLFQLFIFHVDDVQNFFFRIMASNRVHQFQVQPMQFHSMWNRSLVCRSPRAYWPRN